MKRILIHSLYTVLAMIVWAALIFAGTVGGWFHTSIAKQHTSQAFREALEAELNKQFVGNLAMTTLKEGVVEYEKFHSVGKPGLKSS